MNATLERPVALGGTIPTPTETGTIVPPTKPAPAEPPKPPKAFEPTLVVCAMANALGMREPVNEDEANQIASIYERARCRCTGSRAEVVYNTHRGLLQRLIAPRAKV